MMGHRLTLRSNIKANRTDCSSGMTIAEEEWGIDMEKITLKEFDYGKIGFLYEKIKNAMADMGLDTTLRSPIESDYIIKAVLIVLSNLTIEEREKVSREWLSVLLKEMSENITREIGALNDRKTNLTDTVHNLNQEALAKREEIRNLKIEYEVKRQSEEKKLASLLKEKQDAITLESERLHQVRSELSKARRERNDYIRESERIIHKAEIDAEDLKRKAIKEGEEEAKRRGAEINAETMHRAEAADRVYKASMQYRNSLYRVQDANEKYIAVGSLLIATFGDKVEDVANRICNVVGSSRVRETIPSEVELSLERARKEWERCRQEGIEF